MKNKIHNKKAFIMLTLVALYLTSYCSNNKTKDVSLERSDVSSHETLDSSEKIKLKNTQTDSILLINSKKNEELQCKQWEVPKSGKILYLLSHLKEVEGREWNDCYGDWSCGAEGELILKGTKYYFRLDAGGWIILNSGTEQKYYVCRSKSCWDFFPSNSFCDEEGNIIDSP